MKGILINKWELTTYQWYVLTIGSQNRSGTTFLPSYWKWATMCQRIWDTWWQRTGTKGKYDFGYGYVSDQSTVNNLTVVVHNSRLMFCFSFWRGQNCASLGTVLFYCQGNPSSHQDSHQMHLAVVRFMHENHIGRLGAIKQVYLKQQLLWEYLSFAVLESQC